MTSSIDPSLIGVYSKHHAAEGLHLVCVGTHRRCEASCQPKISNLEQLALPLNQYVLRLQIPVNYTVGMAEVQATQ